MKILTLLTMVLFLTLTATGISAGTGDRYLRQMEGDVLLKIEGNADWVPASINTPLQEGDRIWVADDGRGELRFRDGSVLRLDRHTSLDILGQEGDGSLFYLGIGRAYVLYRGDKNHPLAMETPGFMVRADRAAVFTVEAAESGRAEVSVLEGEVYLEQQKGSLRIRSGERVVADEGARDAELLTLAPADAWERWNAARDKEDSIAFQSGESAYLPGELSTYADDLQRTGNWVNTEEYGYVWTPAAAVAGTWSPYRVGRWVWMRGNYVWISYEPWGWVPYHYGRWAHLQRIGWCWVPPPRRSVYWGPGYVGWVYTPASVAWIPLAPGDTYYGYGYYGPGSFNMAAYGKNRPGPPEYRHTRLRNAVVYLSKDDFLKGRRGPFESQENPFLNRPTIPGPPRITPTKATAMPVVKEIPSAKLPPLNVRNGQARENGWTRPASRTLPPPGVSGDTVALRPGSGSRAANPGKVAPVQGGPSAATEKAKPKAGADARRLAGLPAREAAGKRGMGNAKPRSQEIMGNKADVRPAVAEHRAVREAPLPPTPVRPANNEAAQGGAVQRDTREAYRREVPDVQRQKIGESLNQRAATSPKDPAVRSVTVKAAEGVRTDMQRPAPVQRPAAMAARTSERRPATPNADHQSAGTAAATGGR